MISAPVRRAKPLIVVSGVNLVEAGPLAVFQDALAELAANFLEHYDVVALVHRCDLFDLPGIRFLEFPDIKQSWLRRLRFEYGTCRELSRTLNADLWLAMHDMTPNVTAGRRAVYCHNPSPFYRLPWHEAWLDPRFTLFRLLYGTLYSIGIRKNDFVIVQQEWLRREFQRRYGVQRVVVSHPSLPLVPVDASQRSGNTGRVFVYPTFPRCFKNVELILAAVALLEKQGVRGFEVRLTLSGKENRYAAWLLQRFGKLKSVRWMGAQPRQAVEQMYTEADCLLFPSRLETWGMPLTEFKRTGRQILTVDLPYAHETVGSYTPVEFISPTDPGDLARAMKGFLDGSLSAHTAQACNIPPPFAQNWSTLFEILLADDPALTPVGAVAAVC